MEMNNLNFLNIFKKDIESVIFLLREKKYDDAKQIFNQKIFTTYYNDDLLKNGVLKPFSIFLFELDDYFNDENIKLFKEYSDKEYRDYIIDLYEGEFLTEFSKNKN